MKMMKKLLLSNIIKVNRLQKLNLFNCQLKSFSNKLSQEEIDKREKLETDILIVGGGPAGLATAIKLAQLAQEEGKELDITLIEKGEEIGSHVISGNCFEIDALTELIPDWKEKEAPVSTSVTKDVFRILLNQKSSITIPNFMLPSSIHNNGNYIISLSELTRWLGSQAEELGVNVFPGFAAKNMVYDDQNRAIGVLTGDMGISKAGKKKDTFQYGNFLKAKQVILAEGCRGNLSEEVLKKYDLRKNSQHYGLGLKEVWEVDPAKNKLFEPGLVHHTVSWPLDPKTYSGSFMYHMKPNLIHIGLVVGLDYSNPHINLYEEFQKFKTHEKIKPYLEHANCISYGARALNEGGYYSLPKLTFPGGMFVGCSAGMLNVQKIKGAHNAIRSGILAAESIMKNIDNLDYGQELVTYQEKFDNSKIKKELYETRNFHGAFSKGNLYFGLVHGFISNLLKGKEPWSFIPKLKDSEKFDVKEKHQKKEYPKKDGKLTFDILENLSRSGTNHDHDQPSHLQVRDEKSPYISLEKYDGPEQRFCPAKVYEFVEDENNNKKLQINAQNCLHCKCCSIKMVNEYIEWTVPEGSGGPKYTIL